MGVWAFLARRNGPWNPEGVAQRNLRCFASFCTKTHHCSLPHTPGGGTHPSLAWQQALGAVALHGGDHRLSVWQARTPPWSCGGLFACVLPPPFLSPPTPLARFHTTHSLIPPSPFFLPPLGSTFPWGLGGGWGLLMPGNRLGPGMWRLLWAFRFVWRTLLLG